MTSNGTQQPVYVFKLNFLQQYCCNVEEITRRDNDDDQSPGNAQEKMWTTYVFLKIILLFYSQQMHSSCIVTFTEYDHDIIVHFI